MTGQDAVVTTPAADRAQLCTPPACGYESACALWSLRVVMASARPTPYLSQVLG